MKDKSFFYIIIVARDAGDKLAGTVEAALAQSYPQRHVIVKDGASTDGSFGRLKETYGNDKRLTLMSGPDEGIYDAMNIAINAALSHAKDLSESENAWCLFLNCGDLFHDRDVLKKADARIRQVRMRRAARAHVAPDEYGVSLCYGDTFERKTGQIVSANPVIDDFACYRNLPCHQSILYALSLLEKERYNTKWRIRADYEHFLRLRYVRHTEPAYLKMVIADYEGGGYSEVNEDRSEKERQAIIRMYLPRKKVFAYDMYRALSLQPLRAYLAENEKTAALYQKIKRAVYKNREDLGI